MNLHLLHTLNSRNDIMKIKFRLEIGCPLHAFKTASESSLPVPESSSNALTMLMQNQMLPQKSNMVSTPEIEQGLL